jgi:hypothetical protein
MAFRGYVRPGSEIGVRLMAADSNREPATFSAAIVDPPGGTGSPMLVVAPGTSRATAVTVGASGTVRVHVHFTRPDAKGGLEIRINGAVHDFALVIGETWWDYTVGTAETAAAGGPGAPTVFSDRVNSRHVPRNS